MHPPHTRSRPLVRPRLAVAGVACAVLLLTGCSQFSPQTTQLPYVPSDGAQANVGDVGVRNAMLITTVAVDPDSPANFVAAMTNEGGEPVTVDLSADGGQTSVTVPPGDTLLQIGPEQEAQWQVEPVGGAPGETVPVTVTTGGQQIVLDVPVLDGTLEEYRTLVPTGQSDSTRTPADGPTDSIGSPTESPTGNLVPSTPTAETTGN